MPASLAALVFAAGIFGLFWLDRDRETRTSTALWIPVTWVLIAGSRMISQWQTGIAIDSPNQYFEGSPLDRVVLTGLLASGLAVLVWRGLRSEASIRLNLSILLFFVYCGASVLWSDYPDVAIRRWTKALGDFVMVMIVVTDPQPFAAIKRLFSRTAFLLIPISVLLVKYYPEWGRGYDPWTWEPYYGGVAIGKNSLGYVCLVFGLATLWQFLGSFGETDRRRRTRSRIAHGVVLAMTLWLLWISNSATSLACFFLGAALLVITSVPRFARARTTPRFVLGSIALLALTIVLLSADIVLVEALGRDSTLTGRTALWNQLGRMIVEPWLGAGFESFWLGERVEKLWRIYWWHPRQAHNGYFEIFLNLGWVGLAMLGMVIISGYRNINATFRCHPRLGGLALSFFVVALAYNLTEAAFKTMHPVWIAFLLAAAVPAIGNGGTDEAL
jgi:O-antigen ligase